MDIHTQDLSNVPDTIKTKRLILRPLTQNDRADVIRLIDDYDVSMMLTMVPHPYTDADFDAFLEMRDTRELGVIWTINDPDGLCGVISVGIELGYWLGKPYWHRGYMSEAAQAVVNAVFAHSDIPMLKSSHFEENDGSRIILEKLGFEDVGDHEHFSVARDEPVEGRSMLLTRARWVAKRG